MKTIGVAAIDNSPASHIIGSDEVGYGCCAGNLLVVAALVPKDWAGHPKLRDSKQMTERNLQEVFTAVRFQPGVDYWAEWETVEEIDRIGVRNALIRAHKNALGKALDKATSLGIIDPLVISDGNLPIPNAVSLPKADQLVPVVSIASVIAKVLRDRYMVEMGAKYPGYGFEKHVGYGVPAHLEALNRLGPCEIHRKSYAPVRKAIEARSSLV